MGLGLGHLGLGIIEVAACPTCHSQRTMSVMRRSMLLRCFAVFCVIASPSAGLGETVAVRNALPATVGSLIISLNNPDPAVRSTATHELIDAGASARPALCRAIATAGPESATRIAFILMHTQWYRDDDPDPVKQLLAGYGDADADVRRGLIGEQLIYVQPLPRNALLRIVQYDVCSAVRWDAASVLARSIEDETDPMVRELDSAVTGGSTTADAYPKPDQNAALLALDGWACRESNPPHAQELMERALANELANPGAYAGQMDFAFGWLIDRATTMKRYARAAELLREQADRWPWVPQTVAEPVASLFALHADFGPFPGLGDDVRNYRGYFTNPEMIYVLGRWLERDHHPWLASVVNFIALTANGTSFGAHYDAGIFLAQHNWNTVAERELNLCLTLPGGQVFGVYYELSRLASDRDDEFTAGQDLETAARKLLDLNNAAGGENKSSGWSANDFLAQAQWHYLRAARSAHDMDATRDRVDKLLELDQQVHTLRKDPGMAADIVPALQDLGRKAAADRMFADAYNALAAQIATAPTEPMPKNNLAWLCACSGRHLDEAVRLATEAVTLLPDDPACMDTLAEAYFRGGNITKALEIETHAVSVKPDDPYMQKQVKKYQAAAGGH